MEEYKLDDEKVKRIIDYAEFDALMEKKAAHNSTYAKVAVQWLNQALCIYPSLCSVDSEVPGNRHLRIAAKGKVIF